MLPPDAVFPTCARMTQHDDEDKKNRIGRLERAKWLPCNQQSLSSNYNQWGRPPLSTALYRAAPNLLERVVWVHCSNQTIRSPSGDTRGGHMCICPSWPSAKTIIKCLRKCQGLQTAWLGQQTGGRQTGSLTTFIKGGRKHLDL